MEGLSLAAMRVNLCASRRLSYDKGWWVGVGRRRSSMANKLILWMNFTCTCNLLKRRGRCDQLLVSYKLLHVFWSSFTVNNKNKIIIDSEQHQR